MWNGKRHGRLANDRRISAFRKVLESPIGSPKSIAVKSHRGVWPPNAARVWCPDITMLLAGGCGYENLSSAIRIPLGYNHRKNLGPDRPLAFRPNQKMACQAPGLERQKLTGGRTMRRFLAALALLAITFGTSQAVGMERTPPARHAQSIAAVQARISDRVASSPKANPRRQLSATSDFRAEEIIPDICKGCSS